MRIKVIVYVIIAIFIGIVIKLGLNNQLTVKNYTIESTKLTDQIDMVFISDLHRNQYGDNQSELLDTIKQQDPDIIILGGDLFGNNDLEDDPTYELLEGLTRDYPNKVYYVTGNHEYYRTDIEELKQRVREHHIQVLEGDTLPITINDTTIYLSGVNDLGSVPKGELEQVNNQINTEHYNVLVSHRPEYHDDYYEAGYDVTLSGHAHGGQIRIPLILNGLYAPGQGWFPKYAGGYYRTNQQHHIIGRGLQRDGLPIPRFYNPPELVVVHLQPN